MKTYLPHLILLLISFLLFSCAETEDVKTGDIDRSDQLLRIESLVAQLENLEIGVPSDWEKTPDPVERAAYARFMFSTGRIPISLELNDIYTDDTIIQSEYYRAQLIRRFGDIPEVHTLADYPLKRALSILSTDAELKAVVKAHEFLFPDGPMLEIEDGEIRVFQERAREDELHAVAKIRKEDPKAWVEHNRAQLIKEHGDIPDAHIIADFMEKIELGIPINKEEYETYLAKMEELQPGWFTQDQYYVKLEAKSQLGIWLRDLERCKLELYRSAKVEGIPFDMIYWKNINEEHGFCQSVK